MSSNSTTARASKSISPDGSLSPRPRDALEIAFDVSLIIHSRDAIEMDERTNALDVDD